MEKPPQSHATEQDSARQSDLPDNTGVAVFVKDRTVRKEVALLLREAGMQVRLASSRAELAKVLSDGWVSILLADQADLVLEGFEVCQTTSVPTVTGLTVYASLRP